jgi:hypothetical protein
VYKFFTNVICICKLSILIQKKTSNRRVYRKSVETSLFSFMFLSIENYSFISCDRPFHPPLYLGEVPDDGGMGEGVDGVLLGPAGLLQLGQGPLHLTKIKIFKSRSINPFLFITSSLLTWLCSNPVFSKMS